MKKGPRARVAGIPTFAAPALAAALVALASAQEKKPEGGGIALAFQAKKGDVVRVRSIADVRCARSTHAGASPAVESVLSIEVDRTTELACREALPDRRFDVEVRTVRVRGRIDHDEHSETFDSDRDPPLAAATAYLRPLLPPFGLVARGRLDALRGVVEVEEVQREAKDGKRTPAADRTSRERGQDLLEGIRPAPAQVRRQGETWTVAERRAEDGGDVVVKRECRLVRVEPVRDRVAVRIDVKVSFETAPPRDGKPAPGAPAVESGDGWQTLLVDVATGRTLRSVRVENLRLRSKTGDVETVETRRARTQTEELFPDEPAPPAAPPKGRKSP